MLINFKHNWYIIVCIGDQPLSKTPPPLFFANLLLNLQTVLLQPVFLFIDISVIKYFRF